MDTLVSFGWRAEIMAGHAPLALSIRKLLVNGVVVYDGESGFTAPGISLTFYDGTQVTADPFWEGIHGAGNQPAYIYHILVNVVDLPLKEFKDAKPDAWALDVLDAAVLPRRSTPTVAGRFGGSGFLGRLMLDAAHDRLWGAYAGWPRSYTARALKSGIRSRRTVSPSTALRPIPTAGIRRYDFGRAALAGLGHFVVHYAADRASRRC
jgi:hypothetical protein